MKVTNKISRLYDQKLLWSQRYDRVGCRSMVVKVRISQETFVQTYFAITLIHSVLAWVIMTRANTVYVLNVYRLLYSARGLARLRNEILGLKRGVMVTLIKDRTAKSGLVFR